ncbi:MAG: SH3 domain-containing protein [Deltaproteobacteria bacterium]|nr:SH3 domain-containing protein [Candidatus Anaeroferrophillacea bacterium]
MKTPRLMNRAATLLLAGILTAGTIGTTITAAEARPPYRRHHRPPYGRVVPHLPQHHRTFIHGGISFFFHDGLYYRHGPRGYIVVRAPIGAFITTLPGGYRTVIVDDRTYYCHQDVYYQPRQTGYVVVNPPAEVLVPETVTGDMVTVTAQELNLRSGPAITFAVIGRVTRGIRLHVRGTAPGWLYIRTPDGTHGWVAEEFTELDDVPASG